MSKATTNAIAHVVSLDYHSNSGVHQMSVIGEIMARKSPMKAGEPAAGPILAANLCRLGYCDQVVRTTEIAKLVAEKTGRSMSRQRIANLLNAAHITDATLATIAEALGVEPAELTNPIKKS